MSPVTDPERPIKTVLVANRGEIALRVVRACRELELRSVVVYSTADADSIAMQLADDAVCIGPPEPGRSYLNIPNVIGAALRTGADAVHPGYGFLSENADFASVCAEENLIFVGPSPETMTALADKAVTRALMSAAGLPLLPGTTSVLTGAEEAERVAEEIGYPVILKAAAGGGGRGMRVVRERAEIEDAYRRTQTEAALAFGDGSLYIERYLEGARHIEVQILGDRHGNIVHLGERDCSVQRRHQKLLEESPSPALDDATRAAIGAAAVAGARSVGYEGAGTMEFLLDRDGGFWFMEMNARLQVEHPVTEMVCAIDLVAEQLRIAQGQPLSFGQSDVVVRGHAIECRINAEDPARDFAPTTGRVTRYRPPAGPWVRVDSHLEPGVTVSPYYDALLAKVIVWAADRPAAIDRMIRALDELVLEGHGLTTSASFHTDILSRPEFRSGDFDLDLVATTQRTRLEHP
ncbi:acetyl-CoA carboxylase biotin carboxylase subunit [Nocardia ignorata]|uniref:Biotin carboxylase n=1 Tax=Nocardia ignorata TaxID=145285 RepID=A0A4R6PTQ5_NOCIG|nr:acetyl-CoA carboxylase biotin carboxylase subunit [Nocardia ignorata]TDP41627.1 acetyl-CoA carboxylase biotin carboxylase subunit [Nocardia ignorata]